ncbi:MAG TPA: cytochrome P450, partial [Rubrivivax sp.]|nr:cytochrome P450 [Rubrivivax sp.]
TVPAGEVLYCMIGAANHDPAVFAQPERFDVRREPHAQLSFGGGVHYCLGAPLARLEAQLAFEALLRRFASLMPVEAPRWRPMINLRGLLSLRVRGRAAAGGPGDTGAVPTGTTA